MHCFSSVYIEEGISVLFFSDWVNTTDLNLVEKIITCLLPICFSQRLHLGELTSLNGLNFGSRVSFHHCHFTKIPLFCV